LKRAFGLALGITLCAASGVRAQSDTLGYSTPTPKWVGQFTALSANAVLGGVTAGVIQELRGGSFKDGFTRGALGGSVVYAGKFVAAKRFFGAGLLGREVGSIGASMVRNASDRIGTFDRLILPAGFARVYWNRVNHNVNVKVDVYAVGYAAYGFIEDELDFDAHESLSGGTLVFNTRNKVINLGGAQEHHAAGITENGIVFRSNVAGWGEDFLQRALAHERVHMVQMDQLYVTLNDYGNDWVFSKLGYARFLTNHIELNATTEFLKLLAQVISKHADRPWEIEAIYLTR
jgi:hypothetical protein